jgi:NSS family neurotransmitter:Na+ symporter
MSTDQSVNQRFTSRFGLLVSAIGIAIGTGNIWRFPRIAAQNGGENGAGALIIAWVVFLLVWSIPLIILEYMIGRKFRKGVVGAFVGALGKKYAWMGAFVGFVAMAISFFYSVVVGWGMYYFVYMIFHPVPSDHQASLAIWENFQAGYMPFLFHFITVTVGLVVIWQGIRSIEKFNKIIIPLLFLIIVVAVFRSLLLPGAVEGIKYLFRPDLSQLLKPQIWLQAMTQNAWDTGAGWGLFLTYAAYMKVEHGTVKNAFITGIGNNTVSLLMAIMIFSTVFSVLKNNLAYPDARVLEIMKSSGPASSGLTFIWLPQLFASMIFGKVLTILFFLGLVFAGFTSLIAMYEMATRVMVDRGFNRRKSILLVIGVSYLMGIPSLASMDFLNNQDLVWGIGLIISGVMIAFMANRYGLSRLRRDMEEGVSDWKLGRWWDRVVKYFVPAASVLLIIWWMYIAATEFAPEGWYNPFVPFSTMTCLAQWILIALLLGLSNKWLARTDGIS